MQPIPAAIAAITGQPLTEVSQMLGQCIDALKGLAGVNGEVSPEGAFMRLCTGSATSPTVCTPTSVDALSWASCSALMRVQPLVNGSL